MAVVNVNALLTGNATSLVGAANMGKAAMADLQQAYGQAAGAAVASSKTTQKAMAEAAAAAQAQAQAAKAAAVQATQARNLAAAQAEVAAQKEMALNAKTVAAYKAAQEAKARADVLQTQSAQNAAAAQQVAAERAAAASRLASEQRIAADAKAAKAAEAEAIAVQKASATEQQAVAASARAHELAAAQKREAMERASGAWSKAATVITVGTAAVGIGAVAMAADFEKSTMRLHTSGGVAMDDVQKMRDGILEIAQTVGIGASELADGMYDVVSGGYQGAEALNILKAAAQGAKAEGADLSIMAQGLTAVMASYYIPAEEAVQTTNALSTASGLAKGNLQEFTNSLSTVMPIASSVGISFAEISAATAIMTQHGKSANEATQELRNGILNLTKPNEVAAKLMQQLGISAEDVSSKLKERGLGGTLNYLTEAVLNSSEGNKVLIGTFKESQQAAADMQTMIAAMPPQLKQWSQELVDGKLTTQQYQIAVNSLGIEQEAMGDQFLRLAKKSAGFSDAVKSGRADTTSFAGAMATLMGGTTGLQVALDLGGESAAKFADATNKVAEAQKLAGENVATNADTQSTVAAAWDRLTATVGVLAIQLGQTLLPAAQGVVQVFSDTIKFFQENEGAAQALGLAVGAIAASIITTTVAMKAYLAVQTLMTIGTALATGGWTALNAAMRANLIGIIVTAIAALVAGIIWAYNNIGWFKDGVDAAFKWISEVVGGFVSWIQTDFVPFITDAWTNITNVWNGAVQVIGDAMTWLWKNIIEPVWEGIVNAGKLAYVAFMTFVVAPIQWAIGIIADAIKWMYENFWKPAWDEMMKIAGIVWNWLDQNVFKPLGVVFDWAGKVISDWWTNVVEPTWKNVQTGIGIVWNWLVDNVFKPWGETFDFIGKVAKAAWELVIKPAWENLQKGIGTVWDWLSTYVFTPFGVALDALGKGFEAARDVISKAWEAIKDAAREPVRFFVEEVYNKGIAGTWNGIADTVKLPPEWRLAPLSMPFANGGVVPGYATGGIPNFHGGGIMSGYSPGIDDRIIAVGGGEAVMRPEWTKMVGPNGVAAMNAYARANDGNGVRGVMSAIGATGGAFADGGIVDFFGGIGNFLADAGKGVMDFIGGIGSFFADPIGSISRAVGGAADALMSIIPNAGGMMARVVGTFPGKIVQGIGDWALGAIQALMPKPESSAGVWNGSGGALQWPAPGGVITQFFSGLNGHNGVDIANAMGSPVIAAESGTVAAAHWSAYGGGNEVWVNHPNGLQTWYAHLNGFNVGPGQSVGRGQLIGPTGMTGNATGPHVHFMVLNGGWPNVMDPMAFLASGGIVPTFDRGGTLAPGINLVNNATGAPEEVRPTSGLAREIAEALREILSEITVKIDGKSLADYVSGRIILASGRNAGRSK